MDPKNTPGVLNPKNKISVCIRQLRPVDYMKNMRSRFLVPREEETSRELPTQRLLSLMQKDTTYVTSGGADMYCEGTYKTSAKSPTFFKFAFSPPKSFPSSDKNRPLTGPKPNIIKKIA